VDAILHPEPVVVDVGAHIGCFTKRLHDRKPGSRLIAVECCPENLSALMKNVGAFATVVQAAVTYEPEVALLNAVYAGCRSTGGGTIISRAELQQRLKNRQVAEKPGLDMPSEYWADLRPLRTLSLEQLMAEQGWERIDVLKLDCEGSEFSILRGTCSLDRIGLVVGEYHGKERFLELIRERFSSWDFRVLRDGDLGTFWLANPLVSGKGASHSGKPGGNKATTGKLVLDGKVTGLGSDYSLRWVENSGKEACPVLYCRGKRVTREWSLDLSVHSPADGHGGNANTE
jgi:FkbM family methyltransferase